MASSTQRFPFATWPHWALLFLLGCHGILASQDLSNSSPPGQAAKDSNSIQDPSIATAEDSGKSDSSSRPAIRGLINLLRNKREALEMRLGALATLKKFATNEQSVVPGLMAVLQDKNEATPIRTAAFETYLEIDPSLNAFTDAFARILADKSEPQTFRDYAARALGLTARKIAAAATGPEATAENVNRAASALRTIRISFENTDVALDPEVNRAFNALEAKTEALPSAKPFFRLPLDAPWMWLIVPLLLPIVCAGVWFLLLWRSPLRLWTINELLKSLPEFRLPNAQVTPLGLRTYLMVSFFQYHPRVLEAWLELYWEQIDRTFAERADVAERKIHIMLPVAFKGIVIQQPTVRNFGDMFVNGPVCVRIRGEAGSGKTSLACQIAKWAMAEQPSQRLAEHRMLPVIIQEDFEVSPSTDSTSLKEAVHEPPHKGAGVQPASLSTELARTLGTDLSTDSSTQCAAPSLVEAIRKQVSTLIGNSAEVSPGLIKQLLKQKRLLLLIDGRRQTANGVAGTILSDLATEVIEPLRIEADHVSEFMGAYLRERGKRDLFSDREFLEGCAGLAETVGERNITPLLARMYVDQMIVSKEAIRTRPLPGNTPGLILAHLDELNRHVPPEDAIENVLAHQMAKAIAWECVRSNFSPVAVRIQDLATVLPLEFPINRCLPYLRDNLRLIAFLDSSSPRLRFVFDAFAEYLAGLHLTQLLGSSEASWREFLDDAVTKNASRASIKGFILAVRDCCLAQAKESRIPEFVEGELGRIAGLDTTAIEKARQQLQIKRLTQQLSLPNAEDRRAAAAGLGAIGPAAKSALPGLITRLRSIHESAAVRHSVVKALGEIGAETEDVIPALVEALKDRRHRLCPPAAKALIRIGDKAIAALVGILKNKTNDEEFRVAAATTLGAFESNCATAIPILIEILRDKNEAERVRDAAADALGKVGAEATIAATDLIGLMQENKTLRRSAAKALIAIAPAAKFNVISLFEALNQDHSSDAEEVLATFRFSLVRPADSAEDRATEEVRQAVTSALKSIPSKKVSPLISPEILSESA
jgi:HEAT repeat protein